MTALKGQRDERLETLETRFSALRRDLDQLLARLAQTGPRPLVRLARIENVPTSGDNTFSIMFLNGTFTEVAGNQTPTYTDRQNSAAGFAHNVNNPTTTPSQGDIVLVWRWSDRWWFDRGD